MSKTNTTLDFTSDGDLRSPFHVSVPSAPPVLAPTTRENDPGQDRCDRSIPAPSTAYEQSGSVESEPVSPPNRDESSLFGPPAISIDSTGCDSNTGIFSEDVTPLMLKKAPPNLFPLLLAPIDGFFCADDSPQFPMTSIIHMDFTGAVVRESFEAALQDALERHPLLRAHVRLAKRNLPCWTASDLMPAMDWGAMDKPVEMRNGEAFDLAQEVGIRFWIRSSDTATRVTVQVHHACTDGTGVYRFLGDLLACYGLRTHVEGMKPSLEVLDPRLLRTRRRRMSNLANKSDQRFHFILHGLLEAKRVFGHCVQPLAEPNPADSRQVKAEVFPHIETIRFERPEHERLRKYAAQHAAKVNDVLLAEMFRTSVAWNNAHGVKSNRWLRLMMPSDLRDSGDYAMPAANLTSYTFLSFKRAACRDLPSLLQSIREKTSAIKNDRLGTKFADAITLAEYKPYVLSYLLKRNWCMSTATLSNVGDPSKRFTARMPRKDGKIVAGNLTLEHVTGVPPLRRRTHATLAIFSYRRELTISLRCNPHTFSVDDTRKFLSMYESGLRSIVESRASESA